MDMDGVWYRYGSIDGCAISGSIIKKPAIDIEFKLLRKYDNIVVHINSICIAGLLIMDPDID